MSRAAFFDALVGSSVLNGFGLNDDTVFHNWSSEERPTDATPFVILRWGTQNQPVFADPDSRVRAPEPVTVWVHWPKERTNDYTKLIKVLDEIDNVVDDLRNVPGSDGYTLSFVTIGGRSGDDVDDGFNTIIKTGDYQVYSRPSEE